MLLSSRRLEIYSGMTSFGFTFGSKNFEKTPRVRCQINDLDGRLKRLRNEIRINVVRKNLENPLNGISN